MSPGGRVLACTDLDRTLIYSRRAAGAVGADELTCVEHYEGAEASFVTRRAAQLLRTLDEAADLVPCTTRTPAQYRRVRLPRARPGRHALCANGGVLLVDGTPDPDWDAHVRAVVAASAPIGALDAELHRRRAALPEGAVGPVRDAEGLFRYAVVDRARLPVGWVGDLTGWCVEHGWRTSVQGRKLYCLPAGLTKAAAAREVARRLGAPRILAAGDSLLDADLLDAADAGIRPAHGELADSGWLRPHVAVTDGVGARAGEEIVSWLVAHLLPVVQRSPQP